VLSGDLLAGREALLAAIGVGLVVGKPLGFALAAWLVVRCGWATKPSAYSWAQVVGAGALAGIGFTMSLFIAGQAFPLPADFAAAKIGVFAASAVSAVLGVVVLWRAHGDAARVARNVTPGFDGAASRVTATD